MNLDHVTAFRRHGKGGMTAELRDGTQLAVSRARARELRKLGVEGAAGVSILKGVRGRSVSGHPPEVLQCRLDFGS